jgi:hypothetical protein
MYFSKFTVLLLLLGKGELWGPCYASDMKRMLQKWCMQFFTTCSCHGQGETICCGQTIQVLDFLLWEKFFTHTLKMIR